MLFWCVCKVHRSKIHDNSSIKERQCECKYIIRKFLHHMENGMLLIQNKLGMHILTPRKLLQDKI